MILLTFNVLNHGSNLKKGNTLDAAQLLNITEENVQAVLRILENHNIRCTFFMEVSLINPLRELAKKIISKGHEVSFYNHNTTIQEIEKVKFELEEFLKKDIRGIRHKENTLNITSLKSLEFTYISDIENAGILFPFKRLQRSTEIREVQGISVIPESISPYSQIPYNDFVFQMIPQTYYTSMVNETLQSDEFVMIYLDSRQFTDLEQHPFDIPFYRKFNSGKKMEDCLESFLTWINEREFATSRMKDYLF